MIFDPFCPTQGPWGQGPKKCTVKHAIHVSDSHIKFGWISEQLNFGPPTPQYSPPICPTPGAWPRRVNENPVWYVIYLSFVRRHTKIGLKIFEIDFVIEIYWYLAFFAPPQGEGKKLCRCTPHSCKQLTHKICLDFVQWFRRRWGSGWGIMISE